MFAVALYVFHELENWVKMVECLVSSHHLYIYIEETSFHAYYIGFDGSMSLKKGALAVVKKFGLLQ